MPRHLLCDDDRTFNTFSEQAESLGLAAMKAATFEQRPFQRALLARQLEGS